MKTNLTKQILTYTVVFKPAKEGGYIASVPLLPGCMTQGETFEETIEMVKDAISGYLAVLNDQKNPVPEEEFTRLM
ncbi:type II toxin-antitoxin system HicB family antitoxin [Candidatus Gottesmanbacteria bacterium]|nr:type II toxin-antitoxin system HicB family antitoxin [Candidatus Gottesmanbacteria bacterium]